jgi:hypothetical protein
VHRIFISRKTNLSRVELFAVYSVYILNANIIYTGQEADSWAIRGFKVINLGLDRRLGISGLKEQT